MKLLVDIGNRRLKWALSLSGSANANCDGSIRNAGDALDGPRGALELNGAGGTLAPAALDALASLERPASVWVSCVARPEIKKALDEYARRAWSVEPVFIRAHKRQAGIVNGYPRPATLGSDRWAALVAAGDLFPRQPVIVVDAGTAVTVDALDAAGLFRGGVIFPGLHAMQFALNEQTENITLGGNDGDSNNDSDDTPAEATNSAPANALATNTRSAVAGGALLAVAGGIDLAIAQQRRALRAECRVIATGGDAGRVAPLLAADVEIMPDLVLRGLAVIAREAAR